MKHLEESTKIAKDVKFAVLARSLADAARQGQSTSQHRAELARLRVSEREVTDKTTDFAALGRQIGDAQAMDRDVSELVGRLIELRGKELGLLPRSSSRPGATGREKP